MVRISLKWLLLGSLGTCLLLPSVIGIVISAHKQAERLRQDADQSHQRVTEILALGVEKALWDLAPEGAIPLVQSAMRDPRIVTATVLDAQGESFHREVDDTRRLGEVALLERDVVRDGSAIGKVIVEFSFHAVEEEIRMALIQTLVLSGIQLGLCVILLGLVIHYRIIKRIDLIRQQAGKVARKELEANFAWHPTDEIGDLGMSLEETRLSLRRLFEELEIKNVELAQINTNLENIVEERTRTIRTILENVTSGFLLVDRSLRAQDGFTRSCEILLGTSQIASRPLTELLQLSPSAKAGLELGLDQVFEDIFPEEVSLSQIPQRFTVDGRVLSVIGRNVRDPQGKISAILFTILDVTDLEAAERENQRNGAVIRILQNLSSFQDFVKESHERIAATLGALDRGDERWVRRELHTLKGNSAAFGLDPIAKMIHQIEDESEVAAHHVDQIRQALSSFLDDNFELFHVRLGDSPQERYNITDSQLAALESIVAAGGDSAATHLQIKRWLQETQKVAAKSLLGPIQDYMNRFAAMSGKKVDFEIRGGDTQVASRYYREVLQNLIHLLRNAIDHGIEPPDERVLKEPTGHIILQFESTPDTGLRIRVQDDGRGIDPERVWKKAVRIGLVREGERTQYSTAQIQDLIFADGLSTAEQVTETSGRGVGMNAFRLAVTQLGGTIKIASKLGSGTEFVVDLPPPSQETAHDVKREGLGLKSAA